MNAISSMRRFVASRLHPSRRLCLTLPSKGYQTKYAPTEDTNVTTNERGQTVMRDMLIARFPGSRVFEFNDESRGNQMNQRNLGVIEERMKMYDDNIVVSAIVFSSTSSELFSTGFAAADTKALLPTLEKARAVSECIEKSKKVTIANFRGQVAGSAFAVLAASKYRLATANTSFYIDDLVKRQSVPTGGLAYYLCKSFDDPTMGRAIARYLGITGHHVGTELLHELKLVTHIVEDDPLDCLLSGIADSLPDFFLTTTQVPSSTGLDGIRGIIEGMDVATMAEDINEALDDPLSSRYYAINRPVSDHENTNNDEFVDFEASTTDAVMMELAPTIRRAFLNDSTEECATQLAILAADKNDPASAAWAADTLEHMNKIEPNCLKEWFRLTKVAMNSKSVGLVLDEEIDSLKRLHK